MTVKARTKGPTRKRARLDVRLSLEAKQRIEQAALASHQSLTDFVVRSLLRASEEMLQQHEPTRLTNRDRDLLLAALDEGVGPNRALSKAAELFKGHYRQP